MTRFWFKRKKYGYGWTPGTWEGWTITIGYVFAVIYLVFQNRDLLDQGKVTLEFIASFVVLTALIAAISWRMGEPPKWQWGGEEQQVKGKDRA